MRCAGYAAKIVNSPSEEDALVGCEDDFERFGKMLGQAKLEALELVTRPENKAAVTMLAEAVMSEEQSVMTKFSSY